MKSDRLLLIAALLLLALPAAAQIGSVAPSVSPPACPAAVVPAPGLPELGVPPILLFEGGRTCGAFLPDGSPNPDWPDCNGGSGGTLPGQNCAGLASCYCFCRFDHRCDLDGAQCNPLSQCLNSCDANYPGCPYPGGGGFPSSINECL
jgi:hypothetical protein